MITQFTRRLQFTPLGILTGLLLVFIPLYPKIPLFSPIEEYIVRVRLEDIFVGGISCYWLWLVARRKITWKFNGWWLVGLYLLIGLFSLVSALVWTKTIPFQITHILKSVLHLGRYAEYFFLLFLSYSVVRKPQQITTMVVLLSFVVLVAGIYGWGQRYWSFPVFSTMNREYSKGVPLKLDSPYARVQSTFAGHYDYGSFLVLVLPLIVALMLSSSKLKWQLSLFVVYLVGLWGLNASASRSSFAGCLLALSVVCILMAWISNKTITKRIHKGLMYLFLILGSAGIMTAVTGENIKSLWVHTLKALPGISKLVTISESTIVEQYTNPVPIEPRDKPSDVYIDYLETVEIVTVNDQGKTIIEYQKREPVFSKCAKEKELSLCIRLEALWPQAIQGFLTNPLLGSGYGTLNKKNLYHFSEADSTDNNYLRILGETGILGFASFFGFICYALWLTWRYLCLNSRYVWFAGGYIGAVVGLLINSVYIDVFAASKVAFVFWAMTGLMLGLNDLTSRKRSTKS